MAGMAAGLERLILHARSRIAAASSLRRWLRPGYGSVMTTDKLELHLAFRQAVADQHAVWEAVQGSLRDYDARRARRAMVLRLLMWASLGMLLIGALLRFSSMSPVWLDGRLFGLFLIFAWAGMELRQQERRRKPLLLPALSPRALPEAANEFLASCRGRALWWDRKDASRPVRASDLEPSEALMILSDDPDIRDKALPRPKDMDEPVAVVLVEPEMAPEQKVEALRLQPALQEEEGLAGPDLVANEQEGEARLEPVALDTDASAPPEPVAEDQEAPADSPRTPEDDGRDGPYQKGLIRRSWTVFAADPEAFEETVRKLFDPDLAGPRQRDFHLVMSVRDAWARKPWIENPSNLAEEVVRAFACGQAQGMIPANIAMPDRRSVDRLIWEERQESVQLRKMLGLPPKPRAMTRPSAERRHVRAGEQMDQPPLRDRDSGSI